MPFGYDTRRPSTGHGILDRLAPGYTIGQRLAGFGGRIAGAFLGPGIGRVIGTGLNAWDNRHTPNPTDGGASVGGNDYGSFVNGGMGMGGNGSGWGGQMPGQDMFGGYGNGSMFGGSDPFGLYQSQYTDTSSPFAPAPPPVAPTNPFAPVRSGGEGNGGMNLGLGQTGINSGGNKMNGARAGWGTTQGPNYT